MSEDTTTIKLVTKSGSPFCSIVAQMILVISRRKQSLNEGGYEHSLNHMLAPVVWVDAVVYEGGYRSLTHTPLVPRVGVTQTSTWTRLIACIELKAAAASLTIIAITTAGDSGRPARHRLYRSAWAEGF